MVTPHEEGVVGRARADGEESESEAQERLERERHEQQRREEVDLSVGGEVPRRDHAL